jgi:hypothetical protein
MGHRPPVKGGYFPVPPVDSEQDMRSEYLKSLKEVGIKATVHPHCPPILNIHMTMNGITFKVYEGHSAVRLRQNTTAS